LKHTRGNQTDAAKILGISRKALWEKRKRYGIE
jgi:DNA-binding protein Fis